MAKKKVGGGNIYIHIYTYTHTYTYKVSAKSKSYKEMANGDFGTEKYNNIKKGLSAGFNGPMEGKEKRISEGEDRNKTKYLI